MKKFSIFLFLLISMNLSGVALAHSYQQGDIRIGHIWARATAPGMTTAAIYVPLLNTGKEPDKLIGASTELASKIEIHEDKKEDSIMKMKLLDSIVLEPGKPVALRPGGIHLMLIGLKRQLKQGEMFPVTLQFERAGSIKVDVMVAGIGAMSGE